MSCSSLHGCNRFNNTDCVHSFKSRFWSVKTFIVQITGYLDILNVLNCKYLIQLSTFENGFYSNDKVVILIHFRWMSQKDTYRILWVLIETQNLINWRDKGALGIDMYLRATTGLVNCGQYRSCLLKCLNPIESLYLEFCLNFLFEISSFSFDDSNDSIDFIFISLHELSLK